MPSMSQILEDAHRINEFKGDDSFALTSFIREVEAIFALAEFHPGAKEYIYKRVILSKLQGEAFQVLRWWGSNPSWEEIKEELINNFGEKEECHQLYHQKALKRKNYKGNNGQCTSINTKSSSILLSENNYNFNNENSNISLSGNSNNRYDRELLKGWETLKFNFGRVICSEDNFKDHSSNRTLKELSEDNIGIQNVNDSDSFIAENNFCNIIVVLEADSNDIVEKNISLHPFLSCEKANFVDSEDLKDIDSFNKPNEPVCIGEEVIRSDRDIESFLNIPKDKDFGDHGPEIFNTMTKIYGTKHKDKDKSNIILESFRRQPASSPQTISKR